MIHKNTHNHTNEGQFGKFRGGGFLYPPVLLIMAEYGTLKQASSAHLCTKFCPDRFILSPLRGEKLGIFVTFSTLASCVGPHSGTETKVEHGAQLQTFHYPTVSNHFQVSTPSGQSLFLKHCHLRA